MASYNSLSWGITLGETITEYKRRTDELFPMYMTLTTVFEDVPEPQRSQMETFMNRLMTEALEDMEKARRFMRKHEVYINENHLLDGYKF